MTSFRHLAAGQAAATLHASVVSVAGRGVLIRGASGTGKSALALEMMALGAFLVADDRVRLDRRGGQVIASPPAPTAGLIEARGVGILQIRPGPPVPVVLVVDLDATGGARLPPARNTSLCGVTLPLVEGGAGPHLAAALCVMARGRRIDPDEPTAPQRPDFRTERRVDDFSADRQLAQLPEGAARIVLVTGPSGAGRSTAINVLEDLGFEAIDNLPLTLVPRLLDGPPRNAPLALGLDVRNRDFSASNVIELIDQLTRDPAYAPEVLYLDCADGTLIRRYSETRRRHPLAANGSPTEAIEAERDLLAPIRARADVLLDTTDLSPHDLRAELARFFDLAAGDNRLMVSVQSFSYKRGVPRGLDMMFDCRFLSNPHWVENLRPLTGRDGAVRAHVESDPRYAEFFDRVRDLILFLLPAHSDEGKAHLAIGFGCTGGKHRSVTLAENMADTLAEAGWQVSKRHRELERRDSALLRVADPVQQTQPAPSDPGSAPPSEH